VFKVVNDNDAMFHENGGCVLSVDTLVGAQVKPE
jgi:hypothetical protein